MHLRNRLKGLAGIAIGLILSASAAAQSYPSRTIRLIVPFPPGGAGDLVMRPLTQKLTESMGQPFVLENRPGADTIIGKVSFDDHRQNIVPLISKYVVQDNQWVLWEDSEYATKKRKLPGQ